MSARVALSNAKVCFILQIAVLISLSTASVIHVPGASNHTLEYYLCEANATSLTNTVLVLDEPQVVSPGPYCLIENVSNLTIQSRSGQIPVECRGERGFGFFNVTDLLIKHILFDQCGGAIRQEVVKYVNDSHDQFLYYGPGQKAVFVFNHCFNLNLDDIVIQRDYKGFAIIGVNLLGDSVLSKVMFAGSYMDRDKQKCIQEGRFSNNFSDSGSGVFFYYQDSAIVPRDQNDSHSLTVSLVPFPQQNYNCAPMSLLDMLHEQATSIPLLGASGLSIVLSQLHFNVQVDVTASLYYNGGTFLGAAMVLFVDAYTTSSVTLQGNFFENRADLQYEGLGLSVLFYFTDTRNIDTHQLLKPFKLHDTSFRKHTNSAGMAEPLPASVISVLLFPTSNFVQYSVEFEEIDISINFPTAPNRAISGLHAETFVGNHVGPQMYISLQNTTLLCNSIFFKTCANPAIDIFSNSAQLLFINIEKVTIEGELTSGWNAPSSTIYAYSSDVHLSGNMTFQNGSALYGSAVRLEKDSHLYLKEPLYAKFLGNHATAGGAIYADDGGDQLCVIQFTTQRVYTSDNLTDIAITLSFSDNTAAVTGNSVFAGPLYDCSQVHDSKLKVSPRDYGKLYGHVFRDSNPDEHPLQAFASKVCVCNANGIITDCLNVTSNLPVVPYYPGRSMDFNLVAVDGVGFPVYAGIVATITTTQHSPTPTKPPPPPKWKLGRGEDIVQLPGFNCSTVSYSLSNITKYSDISDEDRNVSLNILMLPELGLTLAELRVLECPPGFRLSRGGYCDCISLLEAQGITCDINTGLVSRPTNSWIGIADYSTTKTTIGYADICPPAYCDSGIRRTNVSDPEMICTGSRTGILCGQCTSGLSAVFGSFRCKQCSNIWLLTIPLYAVVGLLLVLILFVLQLTVSKGTVNGVIFYFDVLGLTAETLFRGSSLQFLVVFISLLNLNLGFPLCLYDGMSDAVKTGLQFVFPVYLWMLVMLLIIVSRYSMKLSSIISHSSVQVLATLLYLSYSKLLRTVMSIMTSAPLKSGHANSTVVMDTTVWYYDGSTGFLRGGHIVLFLLAVVTLLFFLLPYTILLTGASYWMRYRFFNHFKPLIDAHHGPYEDKWRFWFGARLWLLVVMLAIHAGFGGTNVSLLFLLHAVLLVAFLILQASFKPFRSARINFLDMSFMINYSILAASGIYLLAKGDIESMRIVSGVLVIAALLCLLGIVVYHCSLVIPKCAVISKRLDDRLHPHVPTDSNSVYQSINDGGEALSSHELEYYRPDLLRESLLDD